MDTVPIAKLAYLHSLVEHGMVAGLKTFLESDAEYILLGHIITKKTALHVATLHENPKVALKMIRIILNTAEAMDTITTEKGEIKAVKQSFLNHQDWLGDTALHKAAYMCNDEIVTLLFEVGADLGIKNSAGKVQIQLIYKYVPSVLKAKFDRSVYFVKPRSLDEPVIYCLDVTQIVLVPNPAIDDITQLRPETNSIFYVLKADKRKRKVVLGHPLVRAFMHLKWRKIRYLIWFSILYHVIALWLVLYTMYIHDLFVVSCPYNPDWFNSASFCQLNNKAYSTTLIVVLLGISATITCKEFYELWTYRRQYLNLENVCQLGILAMMMITFFPMLDNLQEWGVVCVRRIYYQTAAISITVAWIEMMLQLAKLPSLGIYSQILFHVFKTSALFFILFSTLFVGFALGLQILLPASKEYKDFLWSISKLVVMMAGEIDFDDMFYSQETNNTLSAQLPFPGLTKFYYTTFVIMVTVILLNLLIATAVSNTKELFKHGEIQYLSNLLVEIHLMENFLTLPKIQCYFKRWLKYFMVVANPLDPNSYTVVVSQSKLTSSIESSLREVAIQFAESDGEDDPTEYSDTAESIL